MRDSHPVILERDGELAVASAAAASATAGHGAFVLVTGPAGIGKTTLLRAACVSPAGAGLRILTARGLALERGFPYGIVRQLIEPVRATAGPGEWDDLLDGAAGLAARVFDSAAAGSVEDDVPYATTHGLYWLIANLAARGPLLIAVDDVHWADAPSLRWLSHLAARIDGLPAALLLGVRDGPDEPPMLDDLRASLSCRQVPLAPLGREATADPGARVDRRAGRRTAVPGLPRRHRREPVPARVAGHSAARGRRRPARAGGKPRTAAGRPGGAAPGGPAGRGRRPPGPGPGRPRRPGPAPARRRARGPGPASGGPPGRPPARGRRAGARLDARVRAPHRAGGHLRVDTTRRAGAGSRRGRPAAGTGRRRPGTARAAPAAQRSRATRA